MHLLDSNALIAVMFHPERLGKRTRRTFKDSRVLHFPTVAVFELAIKHLLGKLKLNSPIHELIDSEKLLEVPFTFNASAEAYAFPSLIRHDPFDRMILATAKANGAKLYTSDKKLLDLGFEWIVDTSR